MSVTARRALDTIRYREWWIGLPAPIWLVNRRVIAELIEKHGLEPVARHDLLADDPIPIAGSLGQSLGPEALAVLDRRPFPGGIRIPHLHFEGEIFTLSQREWNGFAKERLGDLRAKLGQVGSVGFDQLMELSNAIDTLT